jgi:capsular polysaccharide biosynthesis protein
LFKEIFMGKISYPQEAVDFRLLFCHMKRNAWLLLAIVVSGTLLFGGIYYLKFVVLGREDTYRVSSMFYVGYSYLPFESRNFYSSDNWSEWLHSEGILAALVKEIDSGAGSDEGLRMGAAALSSYLTIQCPENYEMVTVYVTTPNPELSMKVGQVLNELFPILLMENQEIGVDDVRLVDSSEEALKVIPDVRPFRAFMLGAVIFSLFTPIGYFLYASGDIRIRIPDTIVRRYGIPAFCLRTHDEYRELIKYLFPGERLGVVKVGDIPGFLGDLPTLEEVSEAGTHKEVLLVLAAGKKQAAEIESVLRLLQQNNYSIKAALLWQPDRRLLSDYYTLPFMSAS